MGSFHDDMLEMRDRKKVLESYGMMTTEIVDALNNEFENYVFRFNGQQITAQKLGLNNFSSEWSL